jgi:hypothetical protein
MKHALTWKLAIFTALLSPAAVPAASAATVKVTGNSALALAAVVAPYSPLSGCDKKAMARLFAGDTTFRFPATKKISVTADSIECRTSNVDISARSCNLTFKSAKRALRGREANEIYATAATAGATSEGAAGSNIQSFSKLNCSIDLHEIAQKAGGGAECSLETQ